MYVSRANTVVKNTNVLHEDIEGQRLSVIKHIDRLLQDCSISIVNALDILLSCIKPSIWVLYSREEYNIYMSLKMLNYIS